MRVQVLVLDLEHRGLDDVSGLLVDGQVDVDTDRGGGESGGSIHSCKVSLLDERRSLGWVPDNPGQVSEAPARMLRVYYGVREPWRPGTEPGRWYDTPVFTGPVRRASRSGATVEVEAVGKELLWRHVVHANRTWRKGLFVRDVLAEMMDMAGEQAIDGYLPPDITRLSAPVTCTWRDDLWKAAQTVADMANYHLFFNGWGSLQVRPQPARVAARRVFTFSTQTNVTSEPSGQLATGENLVNRWVVEGQASGGREAVPVGFAQLADRHPLSPKSLGRHGRSIAYDYRETSELAVSRERAGYVARKRRNAQAADNPLSVTFDGLPHPELEPWDTVRVETDRWGAEMALTRMTIPLMAGADASYGATDRRSYLYSYTGQGRPRAPRFGGMYRPRGTYRRR